MNCTHGMTITITVLPPTEACSMIAAMHEELPLLFDVEAAERLGDACVAALIASAME